MAKRTVLITGCSEGGMGAALALAFHNKGLHVVATARDVSKMDTLTKAGIRTLPLDVLSISSIKECIAQLPNLDILINNAGAGVSTPISDEDMSLSRARELFDLNVWAPVNMMQACLPLLLKSEKGIVVNHTSVSPVVTMPFNAFYNASKAALGTISDTFRLEVEALGVRVVELKTGHVRTNFLDNRNTRQRGKLVEGSIYGRARKEVESMMNLDRFAGGGTEPGVWAKKTVDVILSKNPPDHVYHGESAWLVPYLARLPFSWFSAVLKRVIGYGELERALKKKT